MHSSHTHTCHCFASLFWWNMICVYAHSLNFGPLNVTSRHSFMIRLAQAERKARKLPQLFQSKTHLFAFHAELWIIFLWRNMLLVTALIQRVNVVDNFCLLIKFYGCFSAIRYQRLCAPLANSFRSIYSFESFNRMQKFERDNVFPSKIS